MERFRCVDRWWIGILLIGFSGWCGWADVVTTQTGDEGLIAEIVKVGINSKLQPEVTFTLQDYAGKPVIMGPSDSARFMIAKLDVVDAAKNSKKYTSYTTRTQTVPSGYANAGASAVQATYDSGGQLSLLEPGKYVYVFKMALPTGFDQTVTHTVGGQILRTMGEVRYFANPLYHFVPNGNKATVLSKVSTTASCNKCHTSMGFHGGGRKEYGLCILCHNPQTVDPDTGNTVDMSVMIHKIHMGAALPSVKSGSPYIIVGNAQSINDYSDINFPMDIRNCTVCHEGPDGNVYKTAPSRAACGSCHDNVDFATGKNHSMGIPQPDDKNCALCHAAEGDEFTTSVAGAHTVPGKSKKLQGLIADILEVTNVAVGQKPTIKFTLKDKNGQVVDLKSLQSIAVTFGWPAAEYTTYLRETIGQMATLSGDAYIYTTTAAIPADAKGTLTFSLEIRRTVTLVDKPEGQTDITFTEGAINPIKYVALPGETLVQRRKIVDINKCNVCHDQLSLHGGQRNQIDLCVICHNPKDSDIARRPAGVGGGESISMALMIHKIHTGKELGFPYVVYGFGNTPHNYNEIGFPGMRQKCSICHVDEVPALPIFAGALPVDFKDKDGKQITMPPTTAACTSCHNNEEAINHALQMAGTTTSTETSCFACHGKGMINDITITHQLRNFLNVKETMGEGPTAINAWMIQ